MGGAALNYNSASIKKKFHSSLSGDWVNDNMHGQGSFIYAPCRTGLVLFNFYGWLICLICIPLMEFEGNRIGYLFFVTNMVRNCCLTLKHGANIFSHIPWCMQWYKKSEMKEQDFVSNQNQSFARFGLFLLKKTPFGCVVYRICTGGWLSGKFVSVRARVFVWRSLSVQRHCTDSGTSGGDTYTGSWVHGKMSGTGTWVCVCSTLSLFSFEFGLHLFFSQPCCCNHCRQFHTSMLFCF